MTRYTDLSSVNWRFVAAAGDLVTKAVIAA